MDYRTLFTVLISSLLIQSIALWITWLNNRDQIGIRDWACGGMLMTVSSVTSCAGLYLTDTLPGLSFPLITLGTTSAILGWTLVLIGARHFHGRNALPYRHLLPLAIFLVLLLSLESEAYWRMTLVSVAIALASALTFMEFFQRHQWRNAITLFTLTMLGFSCVVWAGRALSHIPFDSSLNGWDTLSLYAAIVNSFALTLSMIMLNNARIHQQLSLQASRDPLTGALNRRAFYEKSDALLASLKRNPAELSVCIIDLDHFKRINDTYGHSVGDEVLIQFSAMVRSVIRSEDLFGRYGGEEFVLLLNRSTLKDARQVIERLRCHCESEGIQLDQQRLKLTFSAGLSHTRGPVETTLTSLLHTADQYLYEAKAAGRNRLIAQPEALPA